ncbi:MAG: aldo/keto reductase, partial [Deltaproteobacteria bacterium]|nr:aldo/keto reductase [Deltaproteobacteria bacterium]
MSRSNLLKYPAKFPPVPKFQGISMPFLGLGTIWLGRRWPTDNKNYRAPSKEETDSYLHLAYESGIRMFDTAAAYGESERVLGDFFKQNPEVAKDAIIATKWGEEFDLNAETSKVDHTMDHLRLSLNRSLSHLPKADILYIHKADDDVLSNSRIKYEMLSLIDGGAIKYTGASISKETDIERAIEKDILWVDFVQTGADVARSRPDII